MAGALATHFMGGSSAEVLNNALAGGLGGLAGGGIANLLEGTMMSGMQAAATTGLFSGLFDAVLLGADPLLDVPCP